MAVARREAGKESEMRVCAAGPEKDCAIPRSTRARSTCAKQRAMPCAAVAAAHASAAPKSRRVRGKRSHA